MAMDAQTVITLVGLSAQTTVLVGVFYRLGVIKAVLQGHGERITNLEQKG